MNKLLFLLLSAAAGNVYGRLSNPTTAVLEERLASLEGGRGATCTASGHSAQLLALFAIMTPGDVLIAANKLYGGSITQFGRSIQRFGWECVFVDTDDLPSVEAALAEAGDRCKAVWAESIANPGGSITGESRQEKILGACPFPVSLRKTMIYQDRRRTSVPGTERNYVSRRSGAVG